MHFFLWVNINMNANCSVVPDSLRPHGVQPTWVLGPWDSPGKDTGMGCCFLLEKIFLTQGLKRVSFASPAGRWILYHWATWASCLLRYSHPWSWEVGKSNKRAHLRFLGALPGSGTHHFIGHIQCFSYLLLHNKYPQAYQTKTTDLYSIKPFQEQLSWVVVVLRLQLCKG